LFTEDFNPAQRLATEVCPRCRTVGLAVHSAETIANTPEAEYDEGLVCVCPSITAWCPACGLVGDWLAMCGEPEVKPKRRRKGHSEMT
jgi:hypothetical protein